MSIFQKNLAALQSAHPKLAHAVNNTTGRAYSSVHTAKTGSPVVCFSNGHSAHSLYNPEKEAARLFGQNKSFILFCGIASGIHIRYFLTHYSENCAICEADIPSLKGLLALVDLSDIFLHDRVTILSPCTDQSFNDELCNAYVPVLHGNFSVCTLRPWERFFSKEFTAAKIHIQTAIDAITSDIATQTRFGKIWLRNILNNLILASNHRQQRPIVDTKKTAYVLGAGPSLDTAIEKIKKERSRFVLFSTDTAFSVLCAHTIIPDFFVSIDAQIISRLHAMNRFNADTIAVFDLCANTVLVRQFIKNGNTVIFTAGGHPLAAYAQKTAAFPYMQVNSGTVAISAHDLAVRLGFKNIIHDGLDFSYPEGKAYARGTYLTAQYASSTHRLCPLETAFTNLMFRSKIIRSTKNKKHTYHTALLTQYKTALEHYRDNGRHWTEKDFRPFDINIFFNQLKTDVLAQDTTIHTTLLPFFAWYKNKHAHSKKSTETTQEFLHEVTRLFNHIQI